MHKFLKRLSLFSVLAVIFFLSHRPVIDVIPPLFLHQDKVYHIVEFAFLGIALWINRDLFGDTYMWQLIILSGICWAGLDEIHQYFVDGRDCSFGDFFADIAGLSLPLVFLFLKGRRHPAGMDSK